MSKGAARVEQLLLLGQGSRLPNLREAVHGERRAQLGHQHLHHVPGVPAVRQVEAAQHDVGGGIGAILFGGDAPGVHEREEEPHRLDAALDVAGAGGALPHGAREHGADHGGDAREQRGVRRDGAELLAAARAAQHEVLTIVILQVALPHLNHRLVHRDGLGLRRPGLWPGGGEELQYPVDAGDVRAPVALGGEHVHPRL
mmetsp:Transcript_7316/g.21657  ORF Transcript_7316/g.21657 Transcript_7316/m.21657 type:complete len:200 (-) Transcript_7316:481-1080(-)